METMEEKLRSIPVKNWAGCCVFGCSNTYQNTTGIRFYRFPNATKEKMRRLKWIQAIGLKHMSVSESKWEPTINHRVCSKHFVANKKVDELCSPSFIPTLYLGTNSINRPNQSVSDLDNINIINDGICMQEFITNSEEMQEDDSAQFMNDDLLEPDYQISFTHGNTVETQTVEEDFPENIRNSSIFNSSVIFCTRFTEKNEVETQALSLWDATLYMPLPKKRSKFQLISECKTTGTTCRGFHGASSLLDKMAYKELCGITMVVFNVLLTMVPKRFKLYPNSVCAENKLVLFLMKLKLGISFAALGRLFDCHRTTASRTFTLVLNELRNGLTNSIYWPASASISSCHDSPVVTECMEITIEKPSEVNQQNQTYSSAKSTYTLKYVVGCNTSGFINYVSQGYGGSSTDTYERVNFSKPRDSTVQNKDYVTQMHGNMHSAQQEMQSSIFHPSSYKPQSGVSKEVDASARVHVKRCIQRIRLYDILNKKLALELLPVSDTVLLVCAALANLSLPFIEEKLSTAISCSSSTST